MTGTDNNLRVAGGWLAAASLLLGGSLAFHPPPSPDPDEFMRIIANAGVQWVVVHWVAALALSAFVVAGLIVLTARSRLTARWWTMSAWAILAVGAFWVVTTAVAEATVIAQAAQAGNREMFEAWDRFAGGKSMGFLGLALAVALIAANEASSTQAATPPWACRVAVAAALVAFAGWTLGMVLGIGMGGPIWVVSSLAMSLWMLWFGLALARMDAGFRDRVGEPA